jgi:hypothetical protein
MYYFYKHLNVRFSVGSIVSIQYDKDKTFEHKLHSVGSDVVKMKVKILSK